MPPEARLLGLAAHLPAQEVTNESLAPIVGASAESIARASGIERRYYARAGEGPSDLAVRAARAALDAARTGVEELGLIVFATATPDVCFPGAACYLQEKLGAATIGALDVRAQSAGFLCALDLALGFAGLSAPSGPPDPRYARILVAAGEVMSSGLDESPRGADLTPRFGDGAAVAIVGRAEQGGQVLALRCRTEGTLADRFWCEYPASRQYPARLSHADLAAGRHYPSADLDGLAPIVADRLSTVAREVLDECGWPPSTVDCAIVDYVEPAVARRAARASGLEERRTVVPTEALGHVMAAGLPIALSRALQRHPAGSRILLAAAGPGLTYGAAAVEL